MIATSEISIQKYKINGADYVLFFPIFKLYSQHLFDEKLNILYGERERENDLHFANKAVYFRRFA